MTAGSADESDEASKERVHDGAGRAEGKMNRERVLKVVLVLVGLLFLAGIYPVTMALWHANPADYADAMMLSLYFTLGVFLLLAVRSPSAHRSLIAFTAWSSFAHAAVMVVMALRTQSERELLWGSAILVVIGTALLLLAPGKPSAERVSLAGAPGPLSETPNPASQS